MRALILAAGAILAVSACNNSDSAENAANVGDNVAAEDIVANDTTAIDAATNEAANMAEESDLMLPPIENEPGANLERPAPDRPSRRTPPRNDREPAEPPPANTASTNVVTNSE